MRLTDLTPGQHFELEGGHYEVQLVGARIVLAYILKQFVHDEYHRVPDPNDLTGDQFLTTAFSDLRFNREHETAEDRELDALL